MIRFFLIGNYLLEIEKVKLFLKSKFVTKDLRKLKFLLRIKVLNVDGGLCSTRLKESIF